MSSETTYRLRTDLVIESVVDDGVERYVIKDPRSGKFFRIQSLEHFLIRQFDGSTPLDEIRRRASEERKVLVSEEVLTHFAEKFQALGLLEGKAAGRPDPPSSSLTWKLPLANPERLLDRLEPWARLLCRPWFVATATLSLLAAVLVLVANRDVLVFGLAEVVSLEGLVFVLVTISAVTVLHELAHGIVCRHFGGRVSDMGFLLMYLVPCFYVNVSDTYLFKKRRERLWVIAAGGFFELFVWASAVLLWRLVAPETFVSRVLMVVIAVCGVRSLFNFNPLIKMDGYFLLSEATGVANLRTEAVAGLGRWVRRALGLSPGRAPTDLATRRLLSLPGDRFVTLFGAAALAYTAALVGLIVLRTGGFVFERYGGNALGLFALALVGLLHKPAITAAESAKDVSKEKWNELGSRGRRARFFLVWGGLLLVVACFPWYLRVTSELTIFPQARETVRALADGRIARIHVDEGDRVEAGDLILEYDTTADELERATMEASLKQARRQLEIIERENPTLVEEVRVERRAVATALARLETARSDFERAELALEGGVLPRQEFDRMRNALTEAEAVHAEAEANLALVTKRSRVGRGQDLETLHLTDINAQLAAIEELESRIDQVDERISRGRITASIAGFITTYRFEERVGDYLEEGDDVCEIADVERVVVEMPVPEKEFDLVERGQDVKFKVRGYPGRSFHTTIAEIAPVAEKNGYQSTILLRATIDNADGVLKPGMTGVAKVYCGWSVLAHILTRDLVRFVRTEFWL